MTVGAAIRAAETELAAAGVATPRVDAEWLVGHVAGLSRTALYVDPARRLAPAAEAELARLVDRRRRREPLAYVLGEWGFRRLTLALDHRALVPRPETEVLVERCLLRLRDLSEPRVLDVGVGSGAIALAIVDEHPTARVTAIDSLPAAVELARENAERTGAGARVDITVGDSVRGLSPDTFDLVVSNPPYVSAEELERLEPEVRDWEPREALLDRGQTSLIAAAARHALRPLGWLALETHGRAAPRLLDELESLGYAEGVATRDLAGRQRVVEAQWPG